MSAYKRFRRAASQIGGYVSSLRDHIAKRVFRKRFHQHFGGVHHCYISQNCTGGRFYTLQGRPYTSPTVGLWFESTDFLKFCEHLSDNLISDIQPDAAEADRLGYPVGRVNGIKIFFQHYSTFDEAVATWRRRASRVSTGDIYFLMTDRDGFSDADMSRFNNLPTTRKILFSHTPISGNSNVVYVPGYEKEGYVGDLYSSYHEFNRRIVRQKLFELLSQQCLHPIRENH
jgi:uncharacterized protein (DUF1919 family)